MDHRNLSLGSHWAGLEPSFGRHKILKVICWALYYSTSTYTIEKITEDLKTLPDIMTSWMQGYRWIQLMARGGKICNSSVTAYVPAVLTDEEDCPSRAIIRTAQQRAPGMPKTTTRDNVGHIRVRHAVWLPESCEDLRIRLVTIALAEAAGLRGVDATYQKLSEVL